MMIHLFKVKSIKLDIVEYDALLWYVCWLYLVYDFVNYLNLTRQSRSYLTVSMC